jgi:hypothetical protein
MAEISAFTFLLAPKTLALLGLGLEYIAIVLSHLSIASKIFGNIKVFIEQHGLVHGSEAPKLESKILLKSNNKPKFFPCSYMSSLHACYLAKFQHPQTCTSGDTYIKQKVQKFGALYSGYYERI